MKKTLFLILMALSSFQSAGQLPKSSETVELNGINLYYEVYGAGAPLFLLHGWTQSSKFWEDYIPTYAQHFEVYAIDLRGHGRSSALSADFSIQKSAKDILNLLNHLKIKEVSAIGLSYGGLTLLELAHLAPKRIQSMILIGTSHDYKGGENQEANASFSYENLPTSFVEELRRNHYHGEAQIKALFDPKLNYQIKLADTALQSFNFKTLIVQGDRDEILGIDPAFALHKNMPNSSLWIVPNTGHLAITQPNKEMFLTTSLQFLTREKENKENENKN